MNTEVMIGNYAIARGLVEAGLDIAAAYAGTPSSEILPGILEFNRREGLAIHAEWSTNERVALEVAFGAALAGRKSACMMKQVGLNWAFGALMRAQEKTISGAMVVVACDDPGPQSSQTEQDTRLLASLFGIPVFDPASPREAADVAFFALQYSRENRTPVIIRSTHRVSHARESVPLYRPGTRKPNILEGIQIGGASRLGIIASGMTYSVTRDIISELHLENLVSLYKAVTIYPVSDELVRFTGSNEHILVLEETDQVLEAFVRGYKPLYGRSTGYVPAAGELTYDVVRDVIEGVVASTGLQTRKFIPDGSIEKALEKVSLKPRPPELCSGCPHRASFYAMARAFPKAVFPGDIGCYTLGISIGAVDTCLDMGGGVTLASGFADTYGQDCNLPPILASIGDSTFFHACLTPLADAVVHDRQFTLIIMDNGTTAMTGMQPTPQTGITADGSNTHGIPIEDIVSSLGVPFLKVVDSYDVPRLIDTIKSAQRFMGSTGKGPAVIISRRECTLTIKGKHKLGFVIQDFVDGCIGCKRCMTRFGCPAILFDEAKKRISIDNRLCVECRICLYACPQTEEGKKVNDLAKDIFGDSD